MNAQHSWKQIHKAYQCRHCPAIYPAPGPCPGPKPVTVKTIAQKLYEKAVALVMGAGNLVVVHAVDPSAPHGYAWIIGLPLKGGGFAPLARLLTAAEIGRLSPRFDEPWAERAKEQLALEREDDLSALSPDALMMELDKRDVDPEWGVARPFGSSVSVEA